MASWQRNAAATLLAVAAVLSVLCAPACAAIGGGTTLAAPQQVSVVDGLVEGVDTGEMVVHVRRIDGNSDIYTMYPYPEDRDRMHDSLRRLTHHGLGDWDPEFSPDGGQIAFTREFPDGIRHIMVMDADGDNEHQLTDGAFFHTNPTWSPDGERIAFQRCNAGMRGRDTIWVIRVDGSGQRQITSSEMFAYDPSWSPDGALIAFRGRCRDGETWVDDIWTMRPDGTGMRRLTHDHPNDFAPTWSRDGSLIAFESDRNRDRNKHDVFVMDRDGSDVSLVVDSPLHEHGPARWSPDGRRLIFTVSNERWDHALQLVGAGIPGTYMITPESEGACAADWSPALCHFGGHTYMLVKTAMSWEAAQAWAEARDGHLVTITSEAENEMVCRLVRTRGGGNAWLGCTDLAEEGTWRWITGEPFTYDSWHGGEPNDYGGGEDYAEVGYHAWDTWNDAGEGEKQFVVEFERLIVPRSAGKEAVTGRSTRGGQLGGNDTPQPTTKQVRLVNETDHRLRVNMAWRSPDGQWDESTWSIDAGLTTYLATEGARVEATGVRHWAEALDANLAWRADRRDEVLEPGAVPGRDFELHYLGAGEPWVTLKQVRLTNKTGTEVRLHLAWHNQRDGWQEAIWTFPPGRTAFLAHDDVRIEADLIRHWGEATDGSATWRANLKDEEKPVIIDGDTYYEILYQRSPGQG